MRLKPLTLISPLRGRILAITALAGALAGCAQTPIIQHVAPPNPFGGTRASAVCTPAPTTTDAQGVFQTSMGVRSDGGACALAIQQPGGGNYASFGVDPAPAHGTAFFYNYDGHTYITYTPTFGYAGPDSFTAVLIEGPGQPRQRLHVTATIDATGVVAAKPAIVAPAPVKSTAKASTKAATRSHTVRRHH